MVCWGGGRGERVILLEEMGWGVGVVIIAVLCDKRLGTCMRCDNHCMVPKKENAVHLYR